MYHLDNPKSGNFVIITVDGKVKGEDYERVVPRLERIFESHDKIRLLVKVDSIEGIEPSAVWEDLKLTARHFNDIERLGVMGDDSMSEWIARLSKPFTTAEVRHFDEDEENEAERWVSGKG